MATESPIRLIEDSELVLKSQRFQERKSKVAPINRSGSAPPSIEGSFAAIENLILRQNFDASESEEQLRADPSYFEYYWAHVNLNPRLPPPLISGGNRNLFRNVNSRRLTSFDDSFSSSLRVDHSNLLATHKEESDDDRSPKQEDLSRAQSPTYNQSHSFIHEPNEEAYKNLIDRSENDVSISGVTNSDLSSIRNGIVSLNISNFPKLESQTNPFEFHVARPQIISLPQTYVNMNQFLQNPINYATNPPYMTPGNHIYPNIMSAGYFPQQYTLGGYAVNPYGTGYLPHNGQSQTLFNGQSQTFYGYHLGLPFQLEEPKPHYLGATGHITLNSRRVGPMSPCYYGSPTNLDFSQFTNSPFASLLNPGSPIGWKGHNGNEVINDPKLYSFLDELKSGKGHRLGLSDIFGHIVEFSVDQHGSRFIQQKLEVCSNEEKQSVFNEVLPHASKLMTDVFGNYVIQKFFEYGSAEQRRELGNLLEGQIFSLSMQMYGCRVIQKALDVIDVEQKTKLVRELDGHVLKCVRDQNGNHVIQKCIESIPTENIKFVILSFRGQVAALSKHPYGCRVIQRVLEHSMDELHSQFIVDEILDSVYDLAQDQYGNYVTQYVLEGGKPEERSQVVHKLTGHIVQLSQHKFASNVIEKCLEYGDSAAREIMIEEIIGYNDGSDNLLVMVKDQFANYVVQKVLQTCSDHQREVLLSRIKIHLNSLKKYTYGKHIVARFQQLYGEEIEASGS